MPGEGRKIPYWIEIGIQTDKLRQDMSKWNWKDIMGVDDLGDVFKKGATEAKTEFQRVINSMDIDWEKVFSSDGFKKAVDKIVKDTNNSMRSSASKLGQDELKKVAEFVTEIGAAMKEVGASIDTKGFARSMVTFARSIEPLAGQVDKLEAAFDELFNKINQKRSMQPIVSTTGVISGGKQIRKFANEISALETLLNRVSKKEVNIGFKDNLKEQFNNLKVEIVSMEDEIQALEDKLKQDDLTANNRNNLSIRLAQERLLLAEHYRKMENVDKEYLKQNKGKDSLFTNAMTKDMQEAINNATKYANNTIKNLKKIKETVKTPDNAINVEMVIPSVDAIKSKVNETIQKLNKPGSLNKIMVEIDTATDLSNKDIVGTRKANQDAQINEKEFQKNISRLQELHKKKKSLEAQQGEIFAPTRKHEIEEIEKEMQALIAVQQGLKGVEGSFGEHLIASINKALNSVDAIVKSKADGWRDKIVEALQIDKGDIKIPFSAESSAEIIFNEIQNYFQENQIELHLNKEAFMQEVKQVIGEGGLSAGNLGGTVALDEKSVALAFAKGLQAFFMGDFTSLTEGEKVQKNEPKQKKAYNYFDPSNPFNRDVANSFGEVIKAGTQKGGGKIKDFFSMKGIDVEQMANASAGELLDLLGQLTDRFGSTVADQFKQLMNDVGKNGTGSKIGNFLGDFKELLYTNRISQTTIDDSIKKDKQMSLWNNYVEKSVLGSGLGQLLGLTKNSLDISKIDKQIPEIKDIDEYISIAKNYANSSGLTSINEEIESTRNKIAEAEKAGKEKEVASLHRQLANLQARQREAQGQFNFYEPVIKALENIQEARNELVDMGDNTQKRDFINAVKKFQSTISNIMTELRGELNGYSWGLEIDGMKKIENVNSMSKASRLYKGVFGRDNSKVKVAHLYSAPDAPKDWLDPIPDRTALRNIDTTVPEFELKKDTNKRWEAENTAAIEASKRATESEKLVTENKKRLEAIKTQIKKLEDQRDKGKKELSTNQKKLEKLANKEEVARQAKNRVKTIDAQLEAAKREKMAVDQQVEMFKDVDFSARDSQENIINNEIDKLKKWQKDPEKYRDEVSALFDEEITAARKKVDNAEIVEAQAWKKQQKLDKEILSHEESVQNARSSGNEKLAKAYEANLERLRKIRDDLPNEINTIVKATEQAWAEYDALMDKIYTGTESTRSDYIKEAQSKINEAIQKEEIKKARLLPNPKKEAESRQQQLDKGIVRLETERKQIVKSNDYKTADKIDELQKKAEHARQIVNNAEAELEQLRTEQKDLIPKQTTEELLRSQGQQNVDHVIQEIGNLASQLQIAQNDVARIESYVDNVVKDKKYKKPSGEIGYTKKNQGIINKYNEAYRKQSYINELISDNEAPQLDGFANFSKKDIELIKNIKQDRESLKYIDQLRGFLKDSSGQNRHPGAILHNMENVFKEFALMNEKNQEQAMKENATEEDKFKAQWSKQLFNQMNEFRNVYRDLSPIDGAEAEDVFNDFWYGIESNIKNNLTKGIEALKPSLSSSAKVINTLKPEVERVNQQLKNTYIKKVQGWFDQIREKQKIVNKGDVDGASEAAKNAAGLAAKEISELFPLITTAMSNYKKTFEEDLKLSEENSTLLENRIDYRSFIDQKTSSIKNELNVNKDYILSSERATLLQTRRGELLRDIKTASSKKKGTKKLEKAFQTVNDELAKYSQYKNILSNDAISSVFYEDIEFADQYSAKLQEIISKENELDLAQAKGASQADINSKYEAINKAHIESEDMLRNKLQEKQKALLEDIKINAAEGKSVTDLVKQLDLVNQELVELEVHQGIRKQTAIGGDLYKTSTTYVQSYTTALRNAITAKQELDRLEAEGKNTSDAAKSLQRAEKNVRETINSAIKARVDGPSNNDPRVQALDYLSNTENSYRLAWAKRQDAQRRKEQYEAELEALRTDDSYSTSHQYKDHYNAIKRELTSDYIHSDQYKADRDIGLQTALNEMEKYLFEALRPAAENAMKAAEFGIDVDGATQEGGIEKLLKQNVQKVMYALKQSLGRKGMKIDPKQFEGSIALGAQGGWSGIEAYFEKEFETSEKYKELATQRDTARRVSFESKLAELDVQQKTIEDERKRKLEEIMSATEKEYEPLDKIMKQKTPKFEKIEAGFNKILSDINKNSNMKYIRRQLMEIAKRYGANKYERQEIDKAIEDNLLNRKYSKINPKGVMASVSQDAVREYAKSLLISQQETTTKKQINNIEKSKSRFDEKYKLGQWRADKETEQNIGSQINEALSKYIHTMLNPETNKNLANIFTGDFAKELGISTEVMNVFKALMEKYVYNLAGNYSQGLEVRDGYLSGVGLPEEEQNRFVTNKTGNIDIRKTIEKWLISRRDIAEQDEKKAKKEIADIKEKREQAIEKGGLSQSDIRDAETKKELAAFEAKVTAEKARQKELTTEINRLEKEGASTEELGAIRIQLDQTNDNIVKYEKFANNRELLIEMNRKAAEDERKLQTYTLDEQKLFYEAKRAKAEERLGSDDERVRKKAEEDIARFDDILGRIVAKIETNAAKEREKNDPMNILANKFAGAIRKSLGGNNGLNVDATGLATEATLSQIYEMLIGIVQAMGGKVIRDPEKDAMLAELRALEAKKTVSTRGNSGGSNKRKTPASKYANDFNFTDALNKQADEVRKYNKGTKEYILEQAKLYKLLWDYKASSPELNKLVNKDLYNRAEIKALGLDPKLSSAKKRATAYKSLGGTEDIEALAQEFVNKFKIKIAENIDKTNAASTSNDKNVEFNISKVHRPKSKDDIQWLVDEYQRAFYYRTKDTYQIPDEAVGEQERQKALAYESAINKVIANALGKKLKDNPELWKGMYNEVIPAGGKNLGASQGQAVDYLAKLLGYEKAATVEANKQVDAEKTKTAESQKQVENEKKTTTGDYTVKLQEILGGVSNKTKGTERSLSAVSSGIEKLGKAKGTQAFKEFKESLLALQSGKIPLEDVTQKAQKFVDIFANYKANSFSDLSQWFGKDVQADATSLLGIVKQIFEVTNNAHNARKAMKKAEEVKPAQQIASAAQAEAAATAQVTKEITKQREVEGSYTTEDARRERELRQKLGGYKGAQVDFSSSDMALAKDSTSQKIYALIEQIKTGGTKKEETLQQIYQLIEHIKTHGIKKGESNSTKKVATKVNEAELVKKRALSNHEAILGLGATDSLKITAYKELVAQLDAAVKKVITKTKAKQGTGEAMQNVKALAQRVSAMSFNIMKEASTWDYKVNEADVLDTIKPSADKSIRSQMEELAKKNANGKQYEFLNFDGTKLSYQLTDIKGNVEKVTMEWSELNNQVAITSDKSVAKLEPLFDKLGRANEKIENALQMGYLDKSGKEFIEYDSKLKILNDEMTRIAEKEIITNDDYVRLEQLKNDALRAADEVAQKIAQNKNLYTSTTEMNTARKQFNRLNDGGILDQADLEMVEAYKSKYNEIIAVQEKWKAKDGGKGLLREEAQKELRKTALEAQNLGKELEKAFNAYQKMQQYGDIAEAIQRKVLANEDTIFGYGDKNSPSNAIEKYATLAQSIKDSVKLISDESVSKDEKDAIMTQLKKDAREISALEFNILKDVQSWEYKRTQSDKIYSREQLDAKSPDLRTAMESVAKEDATKSGRQYEFLNFDGTKLIYQLTDIRGNIERVTMEWSEFGQEAFVASEKATNKLEVLSGRLGKFDEKFNNAIGMGYLDENGKEFTNYKSQLKALDVAMTQIAEKDIVDDNDYKQIEQLKNNALRAADVVTKKIAENKKLYTGTTEMNSAKRQFDHLDSSGILDQTDLSMVKAYKHEYDQIGVIQAKWQAKDKGKGLLRPEAQEELRKAATNAQNLGKELEKAYNTSQRLQQAVNNSGEYNGEPIGHVSKVAEDVNIYDQMIAKLKELGAEHIKVDRVRQTATGTIRHSDTVVSDLTVEYDKLTNSLVRYQKQERESLTGLPAFLNGFKKKFNSIMQYVTMSMSIYRVLAYVRQGVQYIKEIDVALTELKKVTDETEETYEKFLDTASKTADKVGSTIKDVVSSTADWARLGYTIQEAHKLAESTQVLMNVSEFTDVNQATDSLISSIQAFKYTAEESMGVVDILNTIGNNYAISTADLAQSLTKSSSALVAANGTLEEAVALTAAANTTIQDADVVGTALKTTSMRLRGTDISTMEEEGVETDGYTSKSKLRGKIKAIAGVDILTEAGAYKSTYQILSEIAKVWKDISDIDQAALLELLAGKRSGSVMAAILQNPDVLKDAFESANEAQGSAQDELEKYMDSFQGRLDKMTNTIQTMWQNALDNDFVKMIISFGTELVKIVNNVGLLKSLFIAIGTILVKKYFQGDLFGGLFGDKSKNISGRLDDARAQTKAAEEKYKRTGHEKDRAEWEAQKQREEMLSKEAEDLKAKETPKSQKASKAKKSTYKDPSIVSAEEELKIAKEELKTAKEAKKAEKIKHKGETKQVQQTFKDVKEPIVIDAKQIELNDLEAKKDSLSSQITYAEDRLRNMQAGKVPNSLRKEVDSSKIKGPFDDIIASEQKQLDIETSKLNDFYEKSNSLDEYDAYKVQRQKVKDIKGHIKSLTAENEAAKTQQIDNIITENAQAEINALKNDLLDIENKIRNVNSEINNTKTQGTSKTTQTPNDIKSDKKSKDNTSNANENIKKAKQSVKQAKKDLKKKQKTPIDLDAEQKRLQKLEAEQSQLLEKQAAAQAQVKQANQDLLKANADMRKGVEGVNDATFEAYGNAKVAAEENLKGINEELKVNQEQIDATNLKIQQVGQSGSKIGKVVSSGFSKIGKAAKKVGHQLKGLVSSMATMYLMTTIMDLAGKAINSIIEWGKGLSESPEEAHEKFENLNNELQATESELDSLKSELKTTQDRIDELLEKDNLSLVEKDELSKLQQTNRELEHQIKLNETLVKQQKQSVNDASFNAMSKYSSQTSFYSEKTKSEREKEAKETGSTIGSTAGMIIGGIIGTIAGGQTVLGAGIGAALGGALGGAAGEASESNAYLSELSVGEAIDKMGLIRAGLKADINTAEQAIAGANGKATHKQKQALQEAEQALMDFDSNMANSMSQLQQYINAIDYSSLTDSKAQKKYRDALDNVLKYNIEMGVQGATTNAFSTMFSEDLITDDLKRVQDIITTALDVNENIDINYLDEGVFSDSDQKTIDAVKARLESVGLSTIQLVGYFQELKNEEQEAMEYETIDVVKEISALTNGVSLLKEAFDEFSESGIVTAETLMKLNTVFGETDGWKDYIDAMSSGVLSVQEAVDATNALAESWIANKIDDPFTFATWDGEKFKHNTDAYSAYLTEIQQLQALGIDNAQELADAAQQKGLVKTAVDTIKEVQRIEDLKKEGKATDEEIAWLEKNKKESAEGYADAVYKQHGVKIEDTALIEKQYEFQQAEESLKKYSDYEKQFGHISNVNSLAHKYFLANNQTSTTRKQLQDLEAVRNLAQTDPEKWRKQYVEEEEMSLGETLDVLLFGTPDGSKAVNDPVSEYLKFSQEDVDNLNAELAEQTQSRKEAWDEMMKIAGEEGLTFEVDTTAFDASKTDQANREIFDSVYNTVAAHVEKKKEEFEKTAEEIKKQLDTAFDSVGLEVILELQDKDKLVDDIQSVYDELINAQKEYSENGYVTVDTMQTLFKLEPKYLDLLVDENGKLNLNKTSLLEVARARILDLGYKQQSTILENAWALASQGSTDAMREQILVMEQATEKEKDWINTQMASIRTALNKRVAAKEMTKAEADTFYTGTLDQVEAVQTTMNLALSDLENTLSSSGNTKKQELEDAFQKAMDYWENRIGANQSLYEQIQNDIDLLEKKGKIAGESYYQAQIDVEKEHLEHLKAQRAEARGFLDDFDEGTDEWWNVANTLNDIENEIDGTTASIQDLNDAQDQVHWTIFDEAHERMENLITQLSNVREILSADEDSFFDDTGEWTDAGIAVLATHIQEIKLAESQLVDVEKELNKLKRSNFDSEQEYYDKLTELTNKQHSYATTISSSEQSIVDMYESSIDAAEEYTQTLIDEYSEYIDNVKEALDAERDLYDFRKSVQKESKNIAELERKISALSASDNKADIAERRKLEQRLAESKESLNDQYYDHARDAQQNALDAEVAAYEETLTKMVEGMRTSLEEATTNMQAFLDSVTIAVSMNADSVLKKYQSTELYLDSALTNPWVAAKEAVSKYGADANNLMDVWAKDGYFAKFSSEAGKNLKSPFNAGKTAAEQFGKTVNTSMGNMYTSVKSNVESSITQLNKLKAKYDELNDSTIRPPSTSSSNDENNDDTSINPKATNQMIEMLQFILRRVFEQDVSKTGIWDSKTSRALRNAKDIMRDAGISVNRDDKYTAETRNAMQLYLYQLAEKKEDPRVISLYQSYAHILPTPFYAKGTTGTKRDELAIVDELGPELILHANPQTGRLEYLTKGSGVVPADLTANLMEWGQFTPDSMNLGSGVNVNMINNSVVKPQYDFNFDSLVHVDHCDQNTVKDLEKMIDNKINDFSKALNYSVKRFAR